VLLQKRQGAPLDRGAHPYKGSANGQGPHVSNISAVGKAPLPVDSYLGRVLDAVRRHRAAIVIAAPGAGKTTRVPPTLAVDGPVVLLQPRRVAARAIARRIAAEQGWALGEEVGWQVRFERRFGERTRLLVATEGILTARLQRDPLLSGFRTVVLDEFHERSIHADLGLALARQAWLARDDLRIVVMSATLDAQAVAAFLGECPVVAVPGRPHPVAVEYAPGKPLADGAVSLAGATGGSVLCFLPGATEIRRAEAEIRSRVPPGLDVVPLHGSLDAAAQDRALDDVSGRRIVLATNLAETSLTVPGVTAVVDTGLHKVARYDPDRAIDSLETERIPADAAEQRAGRAGRLGPGVAWRLWDGRDRLRPHREPEIRRIDLSAVALAVIAWGGDPRRLEWFDPPDGDAIERALALLEQLGAIDMPAPTSVRVTAIGDLVTRFPLHPRLGRLLVEAGGAREAAAVCALLSERHLLAPRRETTASDLLSALDDWSALPAHVKRVAEELERTAGRALGNGKRTHVGEAALRRAVLAGYPDRVARRREAGSPRVRLASGHGAVVAPESGVGGGEFLVAVDVTGGRRGAGSEARIRMASLVEREWLTPTGSDVVHAFDATSGRVRATRVERYGELPLGAHDVEPDPAIAAPLVANAWLERGPGPGEARLLCRLRFAGRPLDLEAWVRRAAAGATALSDVDLARDLPPGLRADLDRLAPDTMTVPSGRSVRLDYREDGSVSASVKLQELFGLADTPRIGARGEPVVLSLLAPNGRPVQTTRDLRSFWERTYREVRRELAGRYPKHPWPQDPWTATPTARTTAKKRVRPSRG